MLSFGVAEPPTPAITIETEANNSTTTANTATGDFTALSSNVYQMMISGSNSTTGDSDYFNIGTLDANDVITVTISGTDGGRGTQTDPRVRLYRAGTGSTTIWDADDRVSGTNLDGVKYQFTITATDTYYLAPPHLARGKPVALMKSAFT